MPVKIWDREGESLYSRVVTGWDRVWTAEEHRSDAEELDRDLDAVLDTALGEVEDRRGTRVPRVFTRAWAVGSALMASLVLESPALVNERPELLWRALANKCRTGARANGAVEPKWLDLRPRSAKEPRREGGKLDYFEMCRWLAEQDFEAAVETFGGHIRNVWQMLERPALRPLVLRASFRSWLRRFEAGQRRRLLEPKVFAEMMKTLRSRWPDRGPGSAKRPVHYKETALRAEVGSILNPVAERFAA